MTDETLILDFCKYLQPIVSGCAGFIRTDGYMAHLPGMVIMMSADETYFTLVRVPVIYPFEFCTSINRFLGLKEAEDQAQLFDRIYFLGSNIKFDSLRRYLDYYTRSENICPIVYSEDNCSNINGFDDASLSVDIGYVKVSDGIHMFRVPMSKSIVPLNKGDFSSLKIYNTGTYDLRANVCMVKYTTYKKKFKLNIETYTNIIVFN